MEPAAPDGHRPARPSRRGRRRRSPRCVDADRRIRPGDACLLQIVCSLTTLRESWPVSEDRDAHLRERRAARPAFAVHSQPTESPARKPDRLVVAEALARVVAVRRRARCRGCAKRRRSCGRRAPRARGHRARAVRQRVDPRARRRAWRRARAAGQEHLSEPACSTGASEVSVGDVPGAEPGGTGSRRRRGRSRLTGGSPRPRPTRMRERADVRRDVQELAGRRHLVEVEERVGACPNVLGAQL